MKPAVAALAIVALLTGCGTATASARPSPPALGTLPSPASAWPQAGFDGRHSSGTTAVGPQRGRVRWTRKLEGNVTPGPVIGVDASVLAASNAGVLHALDPSTGTDRWTFDPHHGGYGADLSTSPAVLGGGTILWPGPGETLYALDARGALLWQVHFAELVLSPAVAGANRVYVSDEAGHLTALKVTASAHRVAWTLDLHGTSYASVTVGPIGTIFTAVDKQLVAVRDEGNKASVRWRFEAKDTVEVSNAVAPDGTVVLGTNADDEYGIGPDGHVRWRFDKKGAYTYSSSVVRPDGTAYFGDHNGRLNELNAATGGVRRVGHGASPAQGKGPDGVGFWTAPAIDARGDAYAGTALGHVYGFGPDAHQLFDLNVHALVDSYPAIGADGTLYIGVTDGRLLAIGG